MATVLITGCSRGLGLELVKQLLADNSVNLIFATSRGASPSPELATLISESQGKVVHIQLDVDNSESITAATSAVESNLNVQGIDILINNAGILFMEPPGATAMDSLSTTLNTNVVGVHKVTAAILPLLSKGNQKKIVNITSTLGSIAMINNFTHSPAAAYKISKAALNMLTAQYALQLGKDGFTVFGVSPGWLKTDLGSQYADLETVVGAKATWDVIANATAKDNGAFRNVYVEGEEKYDGKNPPW